VTNDRSIALVLVTGLVVVALLAYGLTRQAGPTPTVPPSQTPTASSAPTSSASPSSPAPSGSSSTVPSPSAAIPDFAHVWIIVFENQDYDRVVGADDMPYTNGLIERFGLAEQSFGVARPSQPNYFAMFSGSTHGVTDNRSHDIDAPTIGDQIEASGRTWREYAENRPDGCFTGSSSSGGRDGDGVYERKHAPAISFTSIRTDPRRCGYLQDLTAFQPGDADYALIVPNQCHSAHDCPLARADAWLAEFAPRILDSDAFRAGGLLVITFDEDAGDDPSGGHIATILASPGVTAGFRSSEPHDHYTLLRTIQDAWGLDCLAESCSAGTMDEFFRPG
jgi:phosphatidylinositol-3-phosphatase